MTLPIHQFLWLLSNGRSHCSCFRRPFTCLDIVIIFDLFKIVRSSSFGLCECRQVRRWNLRTFSKFDCFYCHEETLIRLQEVLSKTKVESMSRCCDHSIAWSLLHCKLIEIDHCGCFNLFCARHFDLGIISDSQHISSILSQCHRHCLFWYRPRPTSTHTKISGN